MRSLIEETELMCFSVWIESIRRSLEEGIKALGVACFTRAMLGKSGSFQGNNDWIESLLEKEK